MDLKTANICHNKNHPLWSSAIPLIFYINQNLLGSVEKVIDGNLDIHFTSIFFHLQYFLFHSHSLSLGFVREIDLAEGFNLCFSKNRQWNPDPQLWQSGVLPFQGSAPTQSHLQSTNWALGMKHPTWRQVTQCWSQCWQGWTAQISLWLFPKEFTLFNSSRRKMPKGHRWKEFSFTLSHTHSPRFSALTNLLENGESNLFSPHGGYRGLPVPPTDSCRQRPSLLLQSLSAFPLGHFLFISFYLSTVLETECTSFKYLLLVTVLSFTFIFPGFLSTHEIGWYFFRFLNSFNSDQLFSLE